jgi:DNA-binding protein YbaB
LTTPENDKPLPTWEEAEAEIERISAAQTELTAQRTVRVSKDKMVTATVDGSGRLVSLKLRGTKFRSLPAEKLCEHIVETVAAAQDEAVTKMMAAATALLPRTLDLEALLGADLPDIDDLFSQHPRGG